MRFPQLDRAWLIAMAGALVLICSAFLKWRRLPSLLDSYVDDGGQLVMVFTWHWTELLPRLATFFTGSILLLSLLRSAQSLRGQTIAAWTLLAVLLSYPAWATHWAPLESTQEWLLYLELDLVISDMEENLNEQQREWRQWQYFSTNTVNDLPLARLSYQTGWDMSLLAPQQWDRVINFCLGWSPAFFSFAGPGLILGFAGTLLSLFGIHLSGLRPWPQLRYGMLVGAAAVLLTFAVPVVPVIVGERLLARADQARQQGDVRGALANLASARRWKPTLAASWWHHSQVGRLERMAGYDVTTAMWVEDGLHGSLPSQQENVGLERLRMAVSQDPDNAAYRLFLASALVKAGIYLFNQGQYSGAEQLWIESNALVPGQPLAWYGRAQAAMRTRRFEEAARCYQQLVTLQTTFRFKRLSLGGQYRVAQAWAAYHADDLSAAHARYASALNPESW
jgi:tetratricopeptide (TPR) repeat protein